MAEEQKQITDWATAPVGETYTVDTEEDAWEFGPPPPHGIYDVKLFLGRDGVKANFDENGKFTHYVVNIESKVVSDNEDWNGAPAFPQMPISTRMARGKKISTCAGLLVKLGYGDKIKANVTDRALAKGLESALKREPLIKAELDWRGSYSWKNPKNGEDIWENVFNHYEDFPIKDGARLHQVNVASKGGGTAEVRAQLRITRFFGKGDKIPAITATSVAAPTIAQPLAPAPQQIARPIAHVPQPVAQPVNATPVAQVSDDDISFVTE